MVSVMGSLLSHTLWRAVSGLDTQHQPSHPPAQESKCPSSRPVGRPTPAAVTTFVGVPDRSQSNIPNDGNNQEMTASLQAIAQHFCEEVGCRGHDEDRDHITELIYEAEVDDGEEHLHNEGKKEEDECLPAESSNDSRSEGVGGVVDVSVWVMVETPPAFPSTMSPPSWNVDTDTVTLPVSSKTSLSSSSPPSYNVDDSIPDLCSPTPLSIFPQGDTSLELSSSHLSVCSSHSDPTFEITQETGFGIDDNQVTCRNLFEAMTSSETDKELERSEVDDLLSATTEELEPQCFDKDTDVLISSDFDLQPACDQDFLPVSPLDIGQASTTLVGGEDDTCSDLLQMSHIVRYEEDCDCSDADNFGGRTVPEQKKTTETPGSPVSDGKVRRRQRRQYVRHSRRGNVCCNLRREGVVLPGTTATYAMDSTPQPSQQGYVTNPTDKEEEESGLSVSGGGGRTVYKEDIRAYDIYKFSPVDSELQYPRLPPLAVQSDSDTDDSVGSSHEGVRKRKRRTVERRDSVERKRHREEERKTTSKMESEAGTLVPQPPVEEDLSTTSVGSSNIPISTTSRLSSSPPQLPSSSTSPSSQSPFSDSFTILEEEQGEKEREVANDNTFTDDDNDDNDDDDDEASTVVPEDFGDETDSDIEVLAQSESWVDLSKQPESPDRVTPLPFGNGEEYLRLLREAQRESNQSSARVSLSSSRRDTPRDSPHDSPKSPPNSPNTEMATDPEEVVLKGVYINYFNKEGDFIRVEKNTETDWIWDWSSRPDQTPPKEWRFSHPRKGVSRGASIRRVMVGNSSLFSRDVLYTLLITNVLSLLIGTGIGIWLTKRSGGETVISLPIN